MKIDLTELLEKLDNLNTKLDKTVVHLNALDNSTPQTRGMEAWERITGLKKSTFYHYRCTGRVPSRIYTKRGKAILFDLQALEGWVGDGMPTPAQEQANQYLA